MSNFTNQAHAFSQAAQFAPARPTFLDNVAIVNRQHPVSCEVRTEAERNALFWAKVLHKYAPAHATDYSNFSCSPCIAERRPREAHEVDRVTTADGNKQFFLTT